MKKPAALLALLMVAALAGCAAREGIYIESSHDVAENVGATLKIMRIKVQVEAADINGNGVLDIVVTYGKDSISEMRLAYVMGAISGAIEGSFDSTGIDHDLACLYVVEDIYVAQVSELIRCVNLKDSGGCIIDAWEKNPAGDFPVYGSLL